MSSAGLLRRPAGVLKRPAGGGGAAASNAEGSSLVRKRPAAGVQEACTKIRKRAADESDSVEYENCPTVAPWNCSPKSSKKCLKAIRKITQFKS